MKKKIIIYSTASLNLSLEQKQKFYVEKVGKLNCSKGKKITDKKTCMKACDDLKIKKMPNNFGSDGKVCYKNFKGQCSINGKNGAKAAMVCKKWDSSISPSKR